MWTAVNNVGLATGGKAVEGAPADVVPRSGACDPLIFPIPVTIPEMAESVPTGGFASPNCPPGCRCEAVVGAGERGGTPRAAW